MGQSTDAKLMYGYHLGGEDGEWEIVEVDEDCGPDPEQLSWFRTTDDEDEDGEDFVTQAEKHLLANLAGFTETDWQVEGYRKRQREAEKRLGVTFESHCSGEYPMYVLAANTTTAARGYAKTIDFAALTARAATEDWDAKLAAALEALGITPKQDKPLWLLCSYWG